MADLTPPAAPRAAWASAGESWLRTHPAVRIALVYVLARLVTTAFLLLAASIAGPGTRFGPDASLHDLTVGWDGQWYWYVAVHGYPTVLPLTDTGLVAENQWAFMPLYPYLAQALSLVTGSWGSAAVVISLVAGYLSCLVLFRLLRHRLDDAAATWAVVFFAAGPVAALFQVGYAESLFLLWLFLALLVVGERRYAWLYVLIPLMGYTRPGVLAFALFLGLHGIQRWLSRREEPLRTAAVVHIVAAGALAVAVGFSWQVIAGVVTGDPGAYLATELAWRRNWIGESNPAFVPFEGFVQAAGFWFTQWGPGPVVGYIALALLVLALSALLLFEPHVRRLGPEIRLWSASYLVYLLAVFFPQSSLFRLLVPLSPLWGAMALPRSTPWRVGVLVACVAGQWWWVYNMYGLGNTFWQIP